MATVFDVRSFTMPTLSRARVIVSIAVIVVALIAGTLGWQLYKKLTYSTATAYFTDALALYPGDQVQVMGIQVGKVLSIEPQGDQTKVTFEYLSKYKVPANASASIVNPSLVSTRNVALSPAYTSGPALADGGVIPLERTQVPVEFDQLRNQLTDFVTELGPTQENPAGPIGEFVNSFADGLAGKGKELNTSLNSLSNALTTLNDGSGDLFAVVKSLALFINALYKSDGQIVALNSDLAQVTNGLTNSDREVANLLDQADKLFTTVRKFTSESGGVLTTDVDNLAEVTNAIVQPEPRKGLESALHVLPNFGANFLAIYKPTHGSLAAVPAIANFANPLQFVCSAIQAGSRLGYQDSAELCAQYLAPILDAIKFNYLPFGVNLASGADTLPKYVTYSEERLRPPPGYKDTTVPGIFSRDTLFSHGNHEPGWIVAPGMQGVEVQPFTKNMLTPDSLAALMGGPDIVVPTAPPAFGPQPGGAPDQSYPQFSPPPPFPPSGPPTPGAIGNPRGGLPVAIPPPAPQVPDPAPPAGPSPLGVGPLPGRTPCPPKPRCRQGRVSDRPRGSRVRRALARALAFGVAIAVLSACGTWKGIQNVPVSSGPGSGGGAYTVYVQMPDTLALNVNSPVRVADVNVGTVRAIQLKNWVATITIDVQDGVKVPKNVLAKIGQTSLLGSQHLELNDPPDPSAQTLADGDTIPLQNSSAFPTTERTLASIGMVLNGGGIPNLEIITNEVSNLLTGNADQVRDILVKLDTFTAGLNEQRNEIVRAIDSTNNLAAYLADRSSTLDRVLTLLPPAVKQLADQRDQIADAVTAVGGISQVTARTFGNSRADFDQVLRLLQRPLKQLSRSSPLLVGALKLLLTVPFPIDNVPKLIRGDYLNTSLTVDLTLSAIDNGLLTGTGFSGALRALEQSYGRDPNTMIPDVRFTPNPAELPPERGE